jgi:hypothetical protein
LAKAAQRIEPAAMPPDICAFGERIVFGEDDPPEDKLSTYG